MRQQPPDLAVERFRLGEIDEPDRAAADLVLVGRADAAAGGSDTRSRTGTLAHLVEFAMQRENERRDVGDAKIFRRDDNALPRQAIDLGRERVRIDDDAVADD